MAAPIVFISRNRLLAGGRAGFESAFTEAVPAIAATKPRTALFAAYVGADGADLRIVHAFPDPEAMALHFEGASERARSVSAVMSPVGFEVYGSALAEAIDLLRTQAEAAGIGLELFPDAIGGFLRGPG